MIARTLALSFILLLPAAATAAPLNSAHVPEDAKWVLHFNGEAMRASQFGKAIHAHMQGKKRHQEKMAKMTARFGVDLSQAFRGVTIYNNEYGNHSGVMLIYFSKLDHAKMAASFAKKHPNHLKEEYHHRKLVTWKAKMGRHGSHQVTGCLANANTILLSRSPAKVKAALDVMDGLTVSMSANSPLLEAWPYGSILAARANDVDADFRKKTMCPVLKHCTDAAFTFGEQGGKMSVAYRLTTADEGTATQFVSIINGLRAMMQLKLGSDSDLMNMAKSLKVKAKGKSVSIDWSGETGEVLKMMKKMHDKRKKYGGKKYGCKKYGCKKHKHDHKHHDHKKAADKNPPAKKIDA